MDPDTDLDVPPVKVFPLIPALKRDVTNIIDSALSWDQLTAADINFSIVRPLTNRYARLRNMSVVYVCLVVRSYFLSQAESDLAFAGLMLSRANLCEILAMKLLSRFAANYIQLVAVLTTVWNPLAGAAPHVLSEVRAVLYADHSDSAQSAIEMAVSTSAKYFLSAPVTQKVVNDIYSGRVVFSVAANRSILADNYKPRPIEIYNPYNAPFLDHYRLRVPKYGAYLEFLNFALLLSTFVLCLANQDKQRLTPWELAFIMFGCAFTLEEYTHSTEHGWIIYIANMWNAFDFSFIAIFIAYLSLRIKGLRSGDEAASAMAFDVLSCGACILFPSFFTVSNNVVILSGRSYTWTRPVDDQINRLAYGSNLVREHIPKFAQASSFHPVFGPILMTMFAALSNTLLLTILISILSNTFATIDANATREYLFQFTITTIEGVKSDALFSYQPPFNILAFLILKPSSYILSPRALHSLNVFLIKSTSLPQLFIIAIYERYLRSGQKLRETGKDTAQTLFHSLPRHIKHMPLVEALVGSTNNDLYEAIFDVEVEDEFDIFEDEEEAAGVEEAPALRSLHSRESIKYTTNRSRDASRATRRTAVAGTTGSQAGGRLGSRSPTPKIRTRRPTSLGRLSTRSLQQQQNEALPPASPTGKRDALAGGYGLNSPSLEGGFLHSPDVMVSTASERSPLAKLYTSRFGATGSTGHLPLSGSNETGLSAAGGGGQVSVNVAAQVVQAANRAEASARHVEGILEAVGELPVQRLKDEMKELQDRQARIENLLLMLTRGMRNETGSGMSGGRTGTL